MASVRLRERTIILAPSSIIIIRSPMSYCQYFCHRSLGESFSLPLRYVDSEQGPSSVPHVGLYLILRFPPPAFYSKTRTTTYYSQSSYYSLIIFSLNSPDSSLGPDTEKFCWFFLTLSNFSYSSCVSLHLLQSSQSPPLLNPI